MAYHRDAMTQRGVNDKHKDNGLDCLRAHDFPHASHDTSQDFIQLTWELASKQKESRCSIQSGLVRVVCIGYSAAAH